MVGTYANSRAEGSWRWLDPVPVRNGGVFDRFAATVKGRSVEVLCNRGRRTPVMTLDEDVVGEIRDLLDTTKYASVWFLEQSLPLGTRPEREEGHRARLEQRLQKHGLRIRESISTPDVEAWRIVRE